MRILALGPELRSPSEAVNFTGVFALNLRRQFLARGIEVEFKARPPIEEAERLLELSTGGFDHLIAFGSRYFSRVPATIVRKLSSRWRGAVCQFHDSSMVAPKAHADLTFAIRGHNDDWNKVIGWAADPELCKPTQSDDALAILIDHPDYAPLHRRTPDVSEDILSQVEAFQASSLWRSRYSAVHVDVLTSPKNGNAKVPHDRVCDQYGRAHVFLLTHAESVGLSVIESATAGVLPVLPLGYVDHQLLKTVRRVEYQSAVPWPDILSAIDVTASRQKALKQTWANVASRVLEGLANFRK